MTPITSSKIALPLVEAEASPPDWHGWRPAGALPAVEETPEPLTPQGEYNPLGPEAELVIPLQEVPVGHQAELLAPAGGPEAAYAAFHFGADAIYLGLKKFSARAEAENFSLEEVDEITAYAHSLEPRRRVFVTVNTLIRQDELPELVEAVAHLAESGVDAIILQDLGVYHLLRRHFPTLELHASTQLSVHNGAGAAVLRRLGFQRVVLARELTLEEVRDITATAGIETEVFIHGALCYAYSGLCLFSSQTLGRSGNRGKCAYSCRDSYTVSAAPLSLRDGSSVKRDPRTGFPFSMKDLALPDHLPALRAAGVSCFKVEGRKKSPLYVATTTDYYRRLLDGTLSAQERPQVEADLQSVFSRPWTRLFVQSHQDKEVADRDTVGHRGTLVGKVEALTRAPSNEPALRFRTQRALERHDGLQIDLPVLGKPFGFAIEQLWIVTTGRKEKRHESFQAPKGALVEVSLPRDHPTIPHGAPVYCSSSQAVKQKYRHTRPKSGLYRTRRPVDIHLALTREALVATATTGDISSTRSLPGPFEAARDPAAMAGAVRSTFDKLGATHLTLRSLEFVNPAGCFVPVSRLNGLRRELVAAVEVAVRQGMKEKIDRVTGALYPSLTPPQNNPSPTPPRSGEGVGGRGPATGEIGSCSGPSLPQREQGENLGFSLKVDRVSFLAALDDSDLAGIEEIIVDITRDHPTILLAELDRWSERIGNNRLRLALPALTRRWEEKGLCHKIERLLAMGWRRWEIANLSGWTYLGIDLSDPTAGGLDLATDWSIYVLNRLAATELLSRGVQRFALSPEDGLQNLRSLLAEFHDQATVIVYQDTPQFLAESCAYANLIGGCPGKANCKFESMEMVSSHGERVTALDYHCRTIVLNQGPFCLSRRLPDLVAAGTRHLRADFIYRRYEPEMVQKLWRLIRQGKPVPGGHAANLDRGVL